MAPDLTGETMGQRMMESDSIREHSREHGEELRFMVHVWIVDHEGRFLLQKHTGGSGRRAWFCTAGFVAPGETSAQAAHRLAREELGLELNGERAAVVMTYKQEHAVTDVWLFHQEPSLEDLTPDWDEVGAVRWAALYELGNMLDNGELIDMPYFDRFFELVYRGMDAGV